MHSYGITSNGSTEEGAPSNTENGNDFSNGNASTIVHGGDGNAGENGNAATGENSMNNGNSNHVHTNGCSNNNVDGEFEEDSDLDFDSFEANGLTNGQSKQPKKSNFVVASESDLELLQLMGQQLRYMGLDRTVASLIQESGCRLDHPTAAKFRHYVLKGQWNSAESVLYQLERFLLNPKHLKKMKFLLFEQKLLECIEDGRNLDAVYCLQCEIAPLNYNSSKLVKICRYLFTNSLDELKNLAGWEGKCRQSRLKLMDKLQNFLPPSVMLPPRRLQKLLNEAHEHQVDRCRYHNFKSQVGYRSHSLLVDHACSKDDLPCQTKQILSEHRDEVWFIKFSNDGTRLATGSKDGTIFIYEIDPDSLNLTMFYTLASHNYGVAFMEWSPDDHYLIALGPEENAEVCLWDMHTGTLKSKFCQSSEDSLTTCAWHKDSQKFVVGGTRGQFYHMDINGTILDTWEGVRVQALAYRNDGKTVLAADTHYRIRTYNFEDVTDYNLIKEDHSIMSFVCDESGRLALVNIENQGVHLWDLEDRVLIRKFQGPSQSNFTIHSCFGGADQAFAASGSEDNKVYIWQLKREKPISILRGHTRPVNCVAWNSRYPNMLASASDDGTVRIWGTRRKSSSSNKTRNKTSSVITSNNSSNRPNNVINSTGNSLDEVQSMPRSSSSSPSSTYYHVVNQPADPPDPQPTFYMRASSSSGTFSRSAPFLRSNNSLDYYLGNRSGFLADGDIFPMWSRGRGISMGINQPSTSSSASAIITSDRAAAGDPARAAPNSQARSGNNNNNNNSDDTSSSSSSTASPSSSSGSSHHLAKP